MMGRKDGRFAQPLEVKVPSFFRCPISLEVMRSPVSLCTGVTYDRASIQRWLDSGNTTCPATMQPLPSTELVPNLTLRSLIHLWSSAAPSLQPTKTLSSSSSFSSSSSAHDLLRDVRSSADPLPPLNRLAGFFSDPNVEDYHKNSLINSDGCASTLVSQLFQEKTRDVAVAILSTILYSEFMDDSNKDMLILLISSKLDPTISALTAALKNGSMDARIDAAKILDLILTSRSSDFKHKTVITEKPDLLPELIRLIGPAGDDGDLNRDAVHAGLACLVTLSNFRRALMQMVRLSVVPALARALSADAATVPAPAAERALRLMEAAAVCPEGRAAICEGAAEVLGPVVRRMMKVGREGTEAAATVLWSVCHHYPDRRAQEAVSAADGGLTKILLLMQSDCSLAVRQMAGDLLKIFRVNTKSCLAGYDTKTTHIMPF